MEGAQRQAPGHVDVRQNIGEELEVTTLGRVMEDHGGDLSGLHVTFAGGVGVQIPWEGAHKFR